MNHELTDQNETDVVVDPARLQEISRFDLSSAEARGRLTAFAREGAEALRMPIGLVSIVLDSAQYFPGGHGLAGWLAEAEGTPVEWSFCATAVRTGLDYVVPDATLDEHQSDNPLVVFDGVRSYAGAPLISSAGHVLGAYCVIGSEPRDFTSDDMATLHQLAADVIEDLESHLTVEA